MIAKINKKYVLLVEDNPTDYDDFSKILYKMGYDVLKTDIGKPINSYHNAVYVLNTHINKIDFALIDVQLNGQKNGLDIVNYILQNYPSIKIIITTAWFSEDASINIAWWATGLDTIPKPNKTVDEEITIYNLKKLLSPSNPNIKLKVDAVFLEVATVLLLPNPKTQLFPLPNEGNYHLRNIDKSNILCLFAGNGNLYNVPKGKTLLILKNNDAFLINEGLKPTLRLLDERFVNLNGNAAINIYFFEKKQHVGTLNYVTIGRYLIEISKQFLTPFLAHLTKFELI